MPQVNTTGLDYREGPACAFFAHVIRIGHWSTIGHRGRCDCVLMSTDDVLEKATVIGVGRMDFEDLVQTSYESFSSCHIHNYITVTMIVKFER